MSATVTPQTVSSAFLRSWIAERTRVLDVPQTTSDADDIDQALAQILVDYRAGRAQTVPERVLGRAIDQALSQLPETGYASRN